MRDRGAMSSLDPRPAGDPAGMLRYAGTLDTAADAARAPTQRATTALHHTTFVGPAGDAARHEAGDLRHRNIRLAVELRQMADDLRRRAGHVERAQREWERDRHRIVEERRRRRERALPADPFGDEFTP